MIQLRFVAVGDEWLTGAVQTLQRHEAVTRLWSEKTTTMFAIKAYVRDLGTAVFAFSEQKTMYGGKHIAKGDWIFVFASENEGGRGLVASGVVTAAEAIPRNSGSPGKRRASASPSGAPRSRSIASDEASSRPFSNWNDGRPETELNFKLYRQATNKIVGISDEAAAFLRGFF